MPLPLFFPAQIKNRLRRAPSMRQSLVQLAEVIPTSSGRSSYPPSALTRGRLAHFSEIGIYAGNSVNRTDPDWNKVEHRDRSAKSLSHFHAPTLYYAISQPSWLHFVFPTLALGSFPFFNLWVLDWRFWAEQHFFSSYENDFLLLLWIHSPFFSKGHVSHQSSSHQIHSFLNAQRGVLSSCTLYPFSVPFVARALQSAGHVFQSLAVVSPPPSGAFWWVVCNHPFCQQEQKI